MTSEREKRGSNKGSDLHQGVDGADDRATVAEAEEVVPAIERVDVADDGPVDTVAGLVEAHDYDDEQDAEAGRRVQLQALGRRPHHVFLGNAVDDHLVDGDAELLSLDHVVSVVMMLDRHRHLALLVSHNGRVSV